MKKAIGDVFISLKKYIPVLIIFLVIAFIFIGQYKKVVNKIFPPKIDKDQTAQNVLKNQGLTEIEKERLNLIALKLANELGTSYAWYDPRRWTENDKEIFDLLKNLSHTQFKVVSSLYFNVYALKRSLSEDLSKYLDRDLYNQLPIK